MSCLCPTMDIALIFINMNISFTEQQEKYISDQRNALDNRFYTH